MVAGAEPPKPGQLVGAGWGADGDGDCSPGHVGELHGQPSYAARGATPPLEQEPRGPVTRGQILHWLAREPGPWLPT